MAISHFPTFSPLYSLTQRPVHGNCIFLGKFGNFLFFNLKIVSRYAQFFTAVLLLQRAFISRRCWSKVFLYFFLFILHRQNLKEIYVHMFVFVKYMHLNAKTTTKAKIFAKFYFSRYERTRAQRNEICCSRFLLALLGSSKVAHTCHLTTYVCMYVWGVYLCVCSLLLYTREIYC